MTVVIFIFFRVRETFVYTFKELSKYVEGTLSREGEDYKWVLSTFVYF